MVGVRAAPWSDEELATAARDPHPVTAGRPLVGVSATVLVGAVVVGQLAQRSTGGVGQVVSIALLGVALGTLGVRTLLGDIRPSRGGGTVFRVDPGLVWASAYSVLLAGCLVALPFVLGAELSSRMPGVAVLDLSLLLPVVGTTGAATLLVAAATTMRLRMEVDDTSIRQVSLVRTTEIRWDDVDRVTLVRERDAELSRLGTAVRWASRRLSRRFTRGSDEHRDVRVHAVATRDGRCHRCDHQWEMRGDVAAAFARAVAAQAHRRGIEIVTRLPSHGASATTGDPDGALVP